MPRRWPPERSSGKPTIRHSAGAPSSLYTRDLCVRPRRLDFELVGEFGGSVTLKAVRDRAGREPRRRDLARAASEAARTAAESGRGPRATWPLWATRHFELAHVLTRRAGRRDGAQERAQQLRREVVAELLARDGSGPANRAVARSCTLKWRRISRSRAAAIPRSMNPSPELRNPSPASTYSCARKSNWRRCSPGSLRSRCSRPGLVYCDFEDVRRYRDAVELAHAAGQPVGLATLRILKPGEEGTAGAKLPNRGPTRC